MITYERRDKYANPVRSPRMTTEYLVYLDGALSGKIVERDAGFQYIPRGAKRGGEAFPTLRLCQKSLEPEAESS